MPSETPKKTPVSATLPLPLADLQTIIEVCRNNGVKCLAIGDVRLEMHAHTQRIDAKAVQSDEYVAARNVQPNDINSERALQVAGMNREFDAWTQAAAPNVFAEGDAQ